MWRVLQGTLQMSHKNQKEMTSLKTIIFLLVCLQRVNAGTIDALEDLPDYNVDNTTTKEMEKSVDEKMKELRIEMLKFQILSKLNLREVPPPSGSLESSKEAVRLLLNIEDEEIGYRHQTQSKDKEERLIIHAKHNNKRCSQVNETYCKAFSFDLNVNLNMSLTDFWVYKIRESDSKIFSLIVFFSNQKEEKHYGKFSFEIHKFGWSKLELPKIMLPASWKDFTYTVEITDEVIEHSGEHRPFLMVSKSSYVPSRKTREISCNTNDSCCLQPLRVSFAEIGFTWVLYPAELEANMCSGKCRMDHSAVNTHYERAMSKVLESDTNLHESLGECWTLCCKPKQLEAVRVIYNDTDGIIHDQYIPELTVKSCSCS